MIHHHRQRSRNRSPERSWVEKCLGCTCLELFWPRIVTRKWLNISTKSSDYSADSDDGIYDSDEAFHDWPKESRLKNKKGDEFQSDPDGAVPRSRRRKSEIFREQYIDAKELRVSVDTWNVGGELPPEDLDIRDWLDTDHPADIYVIGFQEIIPLNAGNIFGAEDNRPIPIWENIIRETLNKAQPVKTKFKCYSDPPSPSRFKPSDDVPYMEDVELESDCEDEEEIYTFNEESNFGQLEDGPVGQNGSISIDSEEKVEESASLNSRKSTKLLGGTEIPSDLAAHCISEIPNSFKFVKSFKASKSFKNHRPLESYLNGGNRVIPEDHWLAKLDLDSIMHRKRRSEYVRIVSKQMVGVFLTIWVRRSLRKHIQNVHVSTVGVGVMGYIGNKGSISVSMSIYQTHFCFICTHLTSGERDVDAVKRNTDVNEIHRRTCFSSMSKAACPRSIRDHERIIWLGDLNYRINLSYEATCDLISKNDWSKLLESDQLRKGCAFDGWTEGTLNFPPTYKYEPNSDKYYGEDPKVGRRTPAWCDRILSLGKGMRQLSYRRAELRLSDHRPVSASYMIEVEVFSPRKLQKALAFTDAEIGNDES
ncbi:type IV inositol polyphosphate 5-phosphatase 3-like isoform X1 [Cynara cardunculus var. scolymus]|uniref:type IV inositol polyphosphate 5-phosphatase 3-like isoform X1 n=1 Tax=Cynara cardunculus var. scolymus TaxID=59895 RepID=UPI000D62454F|nr:type IV inositol polyphosphate 5-phosphatase 3-like isoform X1 [Cynara cardunculus var. scolymus]